MDQPCLELCSQYCYLTPPDLRYQQGFLELVRDYLQAGEQIYIRLYKPAMKDFNRYLRHLEQYSRGKNLPPREVPFSTFWLGGPGGRVLGNLRLRHIPLNVYGHVGYDIRPSCRRQGQGSRMLALGLEKARTLKIPRLKISCDEKNIASNKIIEKNGGHFIERIYDRKTRLFVNRYYIDLK